MTFFVQIIIKYWFNSRMGNSKDIQKFGLFFFKIGSSKKYSFLYEKYCILYTYIEKQYFFLLGYKMGIIITGPALKG